MSERAAFIDAILNDLADDTARLVFADWLEEHGEPDRAEFIRVQIEGAKQPGANPPARRRAAALLKEHETAWRSALGLAHADGVYERGFLNYVRLTPSRFGSRAAELLAREPVGVKLELDPQLNGGGMQQGWLTAFAANPHLRAVTKIASQGGGFGEKRFVRLLKSPHLANLREIEIFEDPVGAAGVKAIANSPSAFTLEHLDLNEALDDDEDGQDEAVRLLATHLRFAALKHLGLMFNGLTADHVRALLASKTLPRALRLDLEDNDFDEDEFADALAERFGGGSDEGD